MLLCNVNMSCCKQFHKTCIAKIYFGMLVMLNVTSSVCIFRMYVSTNFKTVY